MYKVPLAFILFASNAIAQASFPEKGVYFCKTGNEESICDQILKPHLKNGILASISVEYVGWCGSMGPYIYYCKDNVCEDPGIKLEFKDSKHYRWENKQYGLYCEFEKK